MRLISLLLGKRAQNRNNNSNNSHDSYSQEVKRCLVEYKLKKEEYDLFAVLYYQGYTSYRDFFNFVFNNNITKMREIVSRATEKAEDGCNIDFTFIRFYNDKINYIDIPFDVFTDKKNMKMSVRNTKLWNKENIKRLLVNNQNLRNFDAVLLKEAIEKFRKEHFIG